jgi:hypothetical protein
VASRGLVLFVANYVLRVDPVRVHDTSMGSSMAAIVSRVMRIGTPGALARADATLVLLADVMGRLTIVSRCDNVTSMISWCHLVLSSTVA